MKMYEWKIYTKSYTIKTHKKNKKQQHNTVSWIVLQANNNHF